MNTELSRTLPASLMDVIHETNVEIRTWDLKSGCFQIGATRWNSARDFLWNASGQIDRLWFIDSYDIFAQSDPFEDRQSDVLITISEGTK